MSKLYWADKKAVSSSQNGDKISPFNTLAYTTKPQNGSVYFQEDLLQHVKIISTVLHSCLELASKQDKFTSFKIVCSTLKFGILNSALWLIFQRYNTIWHSGFGARIQCIFNLVL